jgi:hypothetical protein
MLTILVGEKGLDDELAGACGLGSRPATVGSDLRADLRAASNTLGAVVLRKGGAMSKLLGLILSAAVLTFVAGGTATAAPIGARAAPTITHGVIVGDV